MSARLLSSASPPKVIFVPGDIGRRLGQELVEVVVGPIAALRLHSFRIAEPGERALRASDDAPERRTDPDRAALVEGMAGLADLGVRLALGDLGLGELHGEGDLGRRFRRGRGRLRPGGQGVAGLHCSVRRIDRVGKHAQSHRAEQGAQHRQRELVAISGFHTRASLGSDRADSRATRPPARLITRFAPDLATRISAALCPFLRARRDGAVLCWPMANPIVIIPGADGLDAPAGQAFGGYPRRADDRPRLAARDRGRRRPGSGRRRPTGEK